MDKIREKLASGDHATIVALGDSVTSVTFYTQGHLTWVGLLNEALVEAYGPDACTVINSGRAGDTIVGAAQRLDRDVLRFHPDLVIVALGINDAMAGESHAPEFSDRVADVVRRIREETGAEVLIATPNPVIAVDGLPAECRTEVVPGTESTYKRCVALYAETLVKLAANLGVTVVDHHTHWTDLAETVNETKHEDTSPSLTPPGLWLLMGDAIHPGPLGHMLFFRKLAPLFGVAERFFWERGAGATMEESKE